MAADDPFSREGMEIDIDAFDQSQPVTNEQFVTVSLKLIRADTECTFRHWCNIDVSGETVREDDQEEVYRMLKHIENMITGSQMLQERVLGFADHDVRGQLMQERLEQIHGHEFERTPVFDDKGDQIGWGFKPRGPEVDIGEITTWLNQGGDSGDGEGSEGPSNSEGQ